MFVSKYLLLASLASTLRWTVATDIATVSLSSGPTPVEIGHVQHLGGLRSLEVRTLSVHPPIFHLPGFLREKEADFIVKKLEKGDTWEDSVVTGKPGTEILSELAKLQAAVVKGKTKLKKELADILEVSVNKVVKEAMTDALKAADVNKDDILDRAEMSSFVPTTFQVAHYDHGHLVDHVLGRTAAENSHGDEQIPLGKFHDFDIIEYFSQLARARPSNLTRNSLTQWASLDRKLGMSILSRIENVTGIPLRILQQSPETGLQALKYDVGGHYTCHFDTSPDTRAGASQNPRLFTIGFFLNDVPQGGYTVFPGVQGGNSSWTTEEWLQFAKGQACREACEGAPSNGHLSVAPKKGDAVLWYNMDPNRLGEASNLHKMGKLKGEHRRELVMASNVHCGQPVVEGRKIFANFWLMAPKEGFNDSATEKAVARQAATATGKEANQHHVDAIYKVLVEAGLSGGRVEL